MEPIDADAIPGLESRSTHFTLMGAGDRGWVVRRDPPQPPIRIPDVGVAAAGVPHYPARDGVRAGAPAMKAPPPARGAGLTAIIPPIIGGERAMKGKPSGSRALPPADGLGSRGPEGIPRQGD